MEWFDAFIVVFASGMRLAVPLQILLARLGPGALLAPGPGGAFPLAIEEMRWQIQFLSHGAR